MACIGSKSGLMDGDGMIATIHSFSGRSSDSVAESGQFKFPRVSEIKEINEMR